MRGLAAQQQALLDLLFNPQTESMADAPLSWQHQTARRGLKAYQANGHALAERTLATSFPVLGQLLGLDSLGGLARAFWHARPPQRGEVTQWGAFLADYVGADEQLAGEPYLADVVRAEWALHCCAVAPDRVTNPASFGLMTCHEPADLTLDLAPGCAVLCSAWPLADILNAHLSQAPDFATLGQRVAARVAQSVVIWRDGWQARVREAVNGEAAFLTAILEGQSLADALDGAPALDFPSWLPMAVQSGLLLAVTLSRSGAAASPGCA